MKKIIILIAIFSFSFCDIIYMRDGEQLIGNIIEKTYTVTVVQTKYGEMRINNSKIEKVVQEYDNNEVIINEKPNSLLVEQPAIEPQKTTATKKQLKDNDNIRIGMNSGFRGFSVTSTGYISASPAFDYSTQFGINLDFAIVNKEIKVLIGGIYNTESTISVPLYAGSAKLGINDIHINIETTIADKNDIGFNIGGGLNYPIFHGDISDDVIPKIGYQAYVHYQLTPSSYMTLSYTTYNGSYSYYDSYYGDTLSESYSSSGLVVQAGFSF